MISFIASSLNYLILSSLFYLQINDINLNYLVSSNNNLDVGLVYNKVENGPEVIMGHSGLGESAIFNDLWSLEKGTKIHIKRINKENIYVVENIYLIDKFKEVELPKDENYLYLVTCSTKNYNKQWLIETKKSQ